jgi:hypothetical protein
MLWMADAMADTASNVRDEFYAELRRHFSGEQLVELAAASYPLRRSPNPAKPLIE